MNEVERLRAQLASEREARRRMAAELQLAQRLEAVGQLAAGVAHEINTPTQYCMDNARFLQEAFADIVTVLEAYDALASVVRGGHPAADALAAVDAAREAADMAFLLEDVPEALAQSLEGLRQVARIVRAMKDFSHPGGGDKAPADLAALIETALVISHNEYKYVAEVETVFGDGVDAVPCDEGSIKQVVLNLVVNAAHAVQKRAKEGGPRRGRITVRAHVTQGMARVEVQDTGVGIPEAARDKVFDLFFTTKEVGSGTGQGLALAHKVVREQHEGRLGFETEVGVGTTFWFELPLG